jgi:uncharacterized coiled-coil protein SlyX
MALVALVHPEGTLTVSSLQAKNKCTLFQQNMALLASPYTLRSTIPLTLFRQFVSAVEGNAIEITSANFSGLAQLCEEFGFEELRAKLSESPPATETAAKDAEAQRRIAALEEKAEQHDRAIAILKDKFAQLLADIGRLAGGMRALSDEVSAQKTQITAEFAELRREISALKAKVAGFDSLIVSDSPAIFAEFRGKQFKLLWRGSRDGFGASNFTDAVAATQAH